MPDTTHNQREDAMLQNLTEEKINAVLDDVFRELYSGWNPGRLYVSPENLLPLSFQPVRRRDDRIANHPALRIASNRKAERIRELAARGKTRRQIAEIMGLSYQYVSALARDNNIKLKRDGWGAGTRDRT